MDRFVDPSVVLRSSIAPPAGRLVVELAPLVSTSCCPVRFVVFIIRHGISQISAGMRPAAAAAHAN